MRCRRYQGAILLGQLQKNQALFDLWGESQRVITYTYYTILLLIIIIIYYLLLFIIIIIYIYMLCYIYIYIDM